MFRAFVLSLLVFCAFFRADAAGVITIDSPCITLKDIFPDIKIKADIYCGLDYGQEKTINRQMSMYIINKYNIQGARPGEVTFRRKGILLTENKLRDDLSQLLSVMYGDVEVEIANVRMSRDFYYSKKKGYDIHLPKDRFGTVIFSVDNGTSKVNYTAVLKAYKSVYVAKSSIRKGEDLAGKVSLERHDLSRVRGEPINTPEGYIADRNISAGRPVTTAEVMKKPDAFKGSSVQIVYQQGALTVSTRGELMDDAYIGKNVRVKNTESGTVVRGAYAEGRKVMVNSN